MVLQWKKLACTLGLALVGFCEAASVSAEPSAPALSPPAARAESTSTEPAPRRTAEPTEEAQTRYREIVTHAIAEFDAGRFAEARALFLEAHALWPSARTLRTLGMNAFELRMYPRALIELSAALDDARRPLDSDQRRHVTGLVEQTRAFVGRYRVQLSPLFAQLIVDGAPFEVKAGEPLVLAVGDHELRARAHGYGELRRLLQVQGREDEQLSLTLEPLRALETPDQAGPTARATQAAPSPQGDAASSEGAKRVELQRKLAWTAFSVGAAGVALTAVMAGLALDRKKALESDRRCPDEECPPRYHRDVDQLNRFADTATAGAVIAGVGLAGALVLWLTARHEEHPKARVRAASRVALGYAGVSATF